MSPSNAKGMNVPYGSQRLSYVASRMTGLFDARSDYAVRFANERSRAQGLSIKLIENVLSSFSRSFAITSVISRNTVFHFLNNVVREVTTFDVCRLLVERVELKIDSIPC